MKFDLRNIMKTAWSLFRKLNLAFAECLRRAWAVAKAAPINAERIERAKMTAGITETIKSWYAWKMAGFEVVHGSKTVLQVELLTPAKGAGKTFLTSFFGESQVAPIPAET